MKTFVTGLFKVLAPIILVINGLLGILFIVDILAGGLFSILELSLTIASSIAILVIGDRLGMESLEHIKLVLSEFANKLGKKGVIRLVISIILTFVALAVMFNANVIVGIILLIVCGKISPIIKKKK